jgi:four helix bundle protein
VTVPNGTEWHSRLSLPCRPTEPGSLSIAANIAEGNGLFTTPDHRNFFGIARGSVQEGVPLLELARRRKLKADLEEIARMLSGFINGLDKRKQ